MRIGNNGKKRVASNPAANKNTKSGLVVLVAVVMILLVVWVYLLGRKAESTTTVYMWNQEVYKNAQITEDMLEPYDMITAEYEKYAVKDYDGHLENRILTPDDKDYIIGKYAAYPLHQDTIAMTTDLVKDRTNNSDSVLYSYPGKDIVSLDIGTEVLQTFKTMLQPGDKINIIAIYSETAKDSQAEESGGSSDNTTAELTRSEVAFKGIPFADLLNSNGESILDIYADYDYQSTWIEQQYENDDEFKQRVTPSTILVAFTPEEEARYYDYLSKGDVTFEVSVPQREQ